MVSGSAPFTTPNDNNIPFKLYHAAYATHDARHITLERKEEVAVEDVRICLGVLQSCTLLGGLISASHHAVFLYK